jgi:amidohydrolase
VIEIDWPGLVQGIKTQAAALQPQLHDWQLYFHAHPELSWEEYNTSAMMAEELTRAGFRVQHVGTVVIADIGPASAPAFIYRLDMDGLRIQEPDGSGCSQNAGVMHACGHDAHMAIGLGVAQALAALSQTYGWHFRVVCQPAEEAGTARSGANAVIEAGGTEGGAALFGIHVNTGLPAGVFGGNTGGGLLAAVDKVRFTAQGPGGHCAFPHLAGNPVYAGSRFVQDSLAIKATLPPLAGAVIHFGDFVTTGGLFNAIPTRVVVEGTVRTFDPDVQDRIELALRKKAAASAAAEFDLEFLLEYERGYPPVVTDGKLMSVVTDAAREIVGSDKVTLANTQTFWGEDVIKLVLDEFGNVVMPLAFYLVGVGDEVSCNHHSPGFHMNTRRGKVLADAVAVMALAMARAVSGA